MSLLSDNILWNKLQASIAGVIDSDTGQDGSEQGTMIFNPGKFDNGAYSANAANHILFGNGQWLPPNNFSLEGYFETDWSRPNGSPVSDGNPHTFWNWYHDSTNRIKVSVNASGMIFEVVVGGAFTSYIFSTFDWPASTLKHILWVYNKDGIGGGSDRVRIYIDGSLLYNSAVTNGNQANAGIGFATHIFNDVGGIGPRIPLNGLIDNLKVYNDSTQELIDLILNNRNNEGFPSDGFKLIDGALDSPLLSGVMIS
jgi:hypothetical protein